MPARAGVLFVKSQANTGEGGHFRPLAVKSPDGCWPPRRIPSGLSYSRTTIHLQNVFWQVRAPNKSGKSRIEPGGGDLFHFYDRNTAMSLRSPHTVTAQGLRCAVVARSRDHVCNKMIDRGF